MILIFYRVISLTHIISFEKTSYVFMLFMKNSYNLVFGNSLLPFLPIFISSASVIRNYLTIYWNSLSIQILERVQYASYLRFLNLQYAVFNFWFL